MIDGDFRHALPMFQRASIPLVTGPASEAAFHNNVFSSEWSIAIATRRAENRNDRRSHRRRKMHRARITSDNQSGSFTKSDQLFEICRNLADCRRLLFDLSYQTFLVWSPCHHDW